MFTGGTIWLLTHGHMQVAYMAGSPLLYDLPLGRAGRPPTYQRKLTPCPVTASWAREIAANQALASGNALTLSQRSTHG